MSIHSSVAETQKTVVFVAAALVIGAIGVGVQARRSTTIVEITKEVGKPLFGKLKDTSDVASLEVIEVNEGLATLKEFKVAKARGTDSWAIPSESDYPADANQQVRDVATMFVGLKIADVASELSSDHADLGVVEPTEENVNKDGVGKLLIMQDRKNQDLGRLIIGKEVKGMEGARFVRRPDQDVVFVAKIDLAKLSTKFSDWIKKDLLDVNALDIENIELKDYSVVDVQDGQFVRKALSPRMEASLTFDTSSSKWSLEQLLTYDDQGKSTPTPLGAEEELDTQKLNDLKYAIDDLEIVGVYPKPEGLGADLEAGASFVENKDNRQSLAERGFYPQKQKDGSYVLKAANGEAHVTTKDGIQYVLRFGEINVETGVEEGKANRYLFVSARVDDSKHPMPVKEQLPGPPAGPSLEPAGPDPSGPANPTPEAPAKDPKGDEPAKDAPKNDPPKEDPPQEDPKEPAKEDAQGDAKKEPAEEAADDCQQEEATDEPAAKQDEPKADEPKADDPKADDPKADDSKKGEPKADAPKADDPKADPKAEPKNDDKDVETDLKEFRDLQDKGLPNRMDDTVREAEMKRIEKEYQRKIDEREENLKKARARVAELNARFAGWYYVVSEDTYKKIHLGRSDIIKKKGDDAGTPPPGVAPPQLNFPGLGGN